MRTKSVHILWYMALASFCKTVSGQMNNISCYQCVQYTNQECGPEAILPCPASSDRCVTHIIKDKQHGFMLKRECGLSPCRFDDEILNKHLGWDNCDRTKDEYFCVSCCKGNACNKNSSTRTKMTDTIMSVLLFLVFYFC